jgi:hypothetical protein
MSGRREQSKNQQKYKLKSKKYYRLRRSENKKGGERDSGGVVIE